MHQLRDMGHAPTAKSIFIFIYLFIYSFIFFYLLYEFRTTPGVYTRLKPPSHVANIKAAQEKIHKQGKLRWLNRES